ncbi:amino acid adenylation domain-containing protein [Ketobacter sp. MCCC 1A13808]|uniref:non-ribosomal peptide synthetase n=1 Tax=Ketobacter sp. MCCC 1A13808 TaxID=2602738 RepID=UPI0012EC52DA|nr:non-ribosomal peptide synthetase [Ketobacter sp. MCCC 1A13808]MVF12545.1 amino acid adenylation domain-containing protein [Ketobacter sp. MCCC 1A13808]
MNVLELLSRLRQAKISLTLDGEKLKIKAPQGAITPEIKQQLQAAKADIVEFLKEARSSGDEDTTIPSIDRSGELPLSYTQVALWTMDKLNPGTIAYNLPMAFKFSGQLDESILEQSIQRVIARHESLRLRVIENEAGAPIADFREADEFSLPRHGVRIDENDDYDAAIRAVVDQYAHQPFVLALGPLYRFDLVRVSGAVEPHQVLVICLHHIISDGLSQNLLVREVALTYAALLKGQPSPLPDLPIQYLDFAAWQRQQLQGENLQQEIVFWQQQLKGVPSLLALPTDRPRPVIQTTKGAKYHFEFDDNTASSCMTFCQQRNITLFMGLMTALQVVLSRHAQQDDFCLGMPTAGRHQKEVEQLIGFFVNGVLVRADVKANPSWNTLIDRVKNRLLDVLAHQQTPAQLIFDHLDISRNPSYPPLAQVGFQLQNFSGSVQSGEQEQVMLDTFRKMTNLTMEPIRMEEADSKFDMILSLAQQDAKLSGYVEYNTDLFDESTISRIIQHFVTAIKSMVAQPEQRIMNVVLDPDWVLAEYLGVSDPNRISRLTTTQLAFVQDLELRPQTRQYAVGFRYKIEKSVDVEKLKTAIYHVVNSHAALRAHYQRCDLPWCDPAYQVIDAERDVPIEVLDITGQSDPDHFVALHFDRWCYRTHDVFSDVLTRFQILLDAEQTAWLTLSCHHLVIDGISGMAMLQKIVAGYEALLADRALPDFQDGFLDSILRHHQQVDAEPVIRFWAEKAHSVAPLSYSLPKSWQQNNEYQIPQQPVSEALLAKIKTYCRRNKAHPSLFYRLVAALVIQEYCRPEADFVLWDIQAGRLASEESDIGVYYQQSPFIIPLEVIQGSAKAADFYQQQRQYRREIKNNGFVSLSELNRLFPAGNISFQFNYFNFLTDVEMDGSSTLPYTFSSHVDNTVQIFIKDYGSSLEFELWMDGSVFVPQQFLQRMVLVIEQLIDAPDRPFSGVHFDLKQESEQIKQWNATDSDSVIKHSTVIHWFEDTVQKCPDAPAVITTRQTLTYQQLNQTANQLAGLLRQHGIGAGDRVGICLGRSPWMLVAVYGVLKAGASYVPIEASYPQSRIEYILTDCAAPVLITESCLAQNVNGFSGRVTFIDELDLSAFPDADLEQKPGADDAIYTIYTSGSTGNPKGASVTHGGEVNLQKWYTAEAEFSASSRCILVSAFGFDLTQKNLYAPLLCGGAVILPAMDEYDPEIVRSTIAEYKATHINCAPSAFYAIAEHCDDVCAEQLQSLHKVYLGGEPIRLSALQCWLQHASTQAHLVNSYGPTECTDVVSSYVLRNTHEEQSVIPIGKPINNTRIYILNDALNPVPLGIVGEISIAGAGVGLGYLGQEELTAAVFVDDLFGDGRLYKTGDLGRYLPDGNIEYIGRKDFQVKVRGLRIELGEIEFAIKQLAEIEDALVLVQDDQLVGYGLTAQTQPPAGWPAQLRETLPDYMVPASLIVLQNWPLTPNGKIDRKALPSAETQHSNRPYLAPRNDIEFTIADIWVQILKVDRVGVEDSFFELGGHSLLATQIVSRIRKQFEIELPIRDLIVHPTVAQLAERVAKARKAGAMRALSRIDRSQRISLSAAQKRMWLLDQIEPGNSAYHVPSLIKVKGALDVSILEQAFSTLVDRHESLRTHFPSDSDGPLQAFQGTGPVATIERVDVSALAGDAIKGRVAASIVKPFRLAEGPLYRASVFQINDSESILLLVLHHAITDGWSNSLLIRELAQMYIQLRTQGTVDLPEPEFQYADFAVWQNQLLQDTLEQKLRYWSDSLKDVPALELPLDKPRPAVQTFAGETLPFRLSPQASQSITELANRFQATQFMVLLAAYAVLLQRYSGQDAFAIGTPVSGRDRPELENIVGFFVNTIAVKVVPDDTDNFEQLLDQVKETVLNGFEHQEVPFEQIVEELNPARDMSRSPLFQVMLAFQNLPQGEDSATAAQLGDIEIAPFDIPLNTAKFEQTLTLWPQGNLIAGSFTYNTDLFAQGSAQQFIDHFIALCDEIAADSSKALHQYEVLSEREKSLQLEQWNQNEYPYDKQLRVENWFRESANQHSANPAIQFGSNVLTYQQLDLASGLIAQKLVDHGVTPGDFVGLVLDRNLHLMSAVLAVLKAGAVYVPIDSAYPTERIRFICEQSKIRTVVSRPHLMANIPDRCNVIEIDSITAAQTEEVKAPITTAVESGLRAEPDDLIYVIYTSGSTGTPKATGAYRRSEINLLNWYIHQFGMNASDCVLLLSAFGFDLTQKNLFAPLLTGAKLVIPEFQEYDPQRLLNLVEQQHITWVNCAPSAFYPLLADTSDWSKLRSIRYLFLGGEPINLARLQPWLAQADCTLINSYGPTECADIAAWHRVDLETDSQVAHLPIGRPNYNVELFVLGDQQQLLPVGAVGELCIAGDGVGPGYLNQPDLTNSVFLPHPFRPQSEDKIYRTGDRVRYRADGAVVYLGRKDHQIKLRGYRIETGEIQTVINSHDSVRDCHVDVIKTATGAEQLVAWVIANVDPGNGEQHAPDTLVLSAHARQHLPQYMVPDVWLTLDAFPLTPNGKIDRKALPKPNPVSRSANHVEARTPLEVSLAEIWRDVLQLDQVGVHDNFFEIGGHSLLATQVAARIRSRLGKTVTIREFMSDPYIESLARRIEKQEKQSDELPLLAVSRDQRIPLSFAQQRLWLLDKIEPGSLAYNVPTLLRVKGNIDTELLQQALAAVFNRHEGLRTYFAEDEEGPYQAFLAETDWMLPVADIEVDSASPLPEDVEAELKRQVAIELMTPFQLDGGPLFRAKLFRISAQEYVFSVVIHHVVTDGWSMNLLIKDLAAAYIQLSTYGSVFFEPLSVQYADFAYWQRTRLTAEKQKQLLSYWTHSLNGVEPLSLPTDYARPPVQTYNGNTLRFSLPATVVTALKVTAQQTGASLFASLLSAYAVLLQRYSGQQDFCIGTPVAGREHTELETTVGFFVNTLAIRVQPRGELTFRQLLDAVKLRLMDDFSHQEVPFEQIVEALDPARDMSRSPLFQVMLAYQNLPVDKQLTAGQSLASDLSLESYNPGVDSSKYEMTLTLWDNEDSLGGSLQFNTDLFAVSGMRKLVKDFQQLIASLADHPDLPLCEIDFLSEAEKQQQLIEWNQTEQPYDAKISLHAAFTDSATQYAANIAVQCGQDLLTYGQLESLSNRFAHYLIDQGVQPGERVAICLDRNLHLMTVIMGVLKAGATYVPLDSSYPQDRVRYILDSAAVKRVVTQTHLANLLPTGLTLLIQEHVLETIQRYPSHPPALEVSSETLLYLIFTSGSTGKPKGTGAYHRSEMNLMNWYINQFNMTAKDRVLLLSAVGFDLTQKNLFAPLLTGATLVIPSFTEFDVGLINSLIATAGVTWLNCAPSAFYAMQDEPNQWANLATLRLLFLGGEPINLSRLHHWLPQSRCQLINSYGPTECTDIAAWYAVDPDRDLQAAALPIGRPNYNVHLYVLGSDLELLPIGAIGELCIGGAGVGPGYINNAEQTQQSFVINPYVPGETIYRTGDRVRYREDGVIEYLGRIDHQIKLRGYRIEAGEIQAVINQVAGVKDSLVDLVEDAQGVKRLAAWLVVAQDSGDWGAQLSAHCAGFLPAYMLPEFWTPLPEFPLTPNGKVDRKALPAPALGSDEEYVAPQTELETRLCDAWANVLGVERVGVTDNFFRLGGQSLLATQLVSRVARLLNRSVSVRTLFEYPTVQGFINAVDQQTMQLQRPPVKRRSERELAPLSFGQQRLWFFEQMNPGTGANSMPVVIKLTGELDHSILEKAFREVIRRHESLRTHFTVDDAGEPVQIIQQQIDFRLKRLDLSNLSEEDAEQALQRAIQANNATPIQLTQAPLLSATLAENSRLVPSQYHLLLNMHHIISDGASQVVLFRELMTLYLAFLHHQPSPLPELAIQYGDFAQWQRDWMQPDVMGQHLEYWQTKLRQAPKLLELPLDFPRPAVQSTAGDTVSLQFETGFVKRLRQHCNDSEVTPFMFMLLGWKLLLSRYSGQQDILVGVPTMGRHTPELEPVIGFFIQSLVLRSRFEQNPITRNALAALRKTVLEGFSHGDVPVDLIVERLGIPRSSSHSPLVQVAFQLLDNAGFNATSLIENAKVGDLQVEMLGSQTHTAKFDLTLNLVLNDDQLSASLEYNTRLFKRSTAEQLCQHYLALCLDMMDSPDKPVRALSLFGNTELLTELEADLDRFSQAMPLSAMQYDMFMDNLVNPDTLQSSHGWHIHVHRELDIELWRKAIQYLTDHQPMLRVQFLASEKPYLDMGYLLVEQSKLVELEVIDLACSTGIEPIPELEEVVRTRIYRTYNLHTDDLISHHVVRLSDAHFVVITAVHHAILDGAALNSYWQQLITVYESLAQQQQPRIDVVDYNEFVRLDRQQMDTAPVLEFWRNQFAGTAPLDFTIPAPVPPAAHFVTKERWLEDTHWQAIKAFSRANRITPSHYFKCLFGLLIRQYCRADSDFTIQETMGGRIKGHAEALGCYIQEIPFIFKLEQLAADKTFKQLLSYAREYQKEIKNQRLISIGKQLALSPRGRIGFMFNFYQFLATTEFLGETLSPEGTPSDPANNVQFVVTEVANKLKMNLFFHQHLFADFGLLQRIESISQQILAAPDIPFSELTFVADATEKMKLLETWNQTHQAFDLSLCVHQKFEHQVLMTPDAVAIVDDQVRYSYQELNQRANQLAHTLINKGVEPGRLIGLCAERSADFLVGILGIMKAGAAYVPMDPKYPDERVAYMVENSQVPVLITQAHLLQKTANAPQSAERLCLDRDWDQIASQSTANPNLLLTPRNRAYMIYTSGSTGMPKGAIVRHDGALNHIEAERQVLDFPADFSFLQSAPASSDISVWQFLGPVTCGGRVVVLDDVTHSEKLFRLVKENRVDVVELVPVALQLLMEYVRALPRENRSLPALKWMMATGEAVSVDLVNEWLALFPGIPVVNAYGPTEAADDVIQCAITEPLPPHQKTVPIGKPLANLSVYIVDELLRLVPAGIAGEICIGGIGVGEGYWNNPEKTRQAFVADPYSAKPDAVMYRTGDLGRWLQDGSVEYLDRVDNQVKIRGFRIELGEIESALSAIPGVRENVVAVRDDLPGGKAIAAYVVATHQAGDLDPVALRALLREKLPDFMVPAALVVMESLPLTPAGKIDRKALPRPDVIQLSGGEYVAPRNETESRLADIWQSLMPVERISIRDNFFEIGGHSLIGVRIMARVNKVFGTQFQVAALLTSQTIEKLAQLIESDEQTDSCLVPIAVNTNAPIFMVHPVGGDVLCYADLAKALADGFSVYGLRAQGLDGGTAPFSSLDNMVAEYVRCIRSVQPRGPYQILGQSLGGIFALAIAAKLEAEGQTVTQVWLLDSYSPDYLKAHNPGTDQILSSALGRSIAASSATADEKNEASAESFYNLAKQSGSLPEEWSYQQFNGLYQVAVQNHTLASQYEVENIRACVHHFTAEDNVTGVPSRQSWERVRSGFSYHDVPGGHESMMQGVNASELAARITQTLNSDNNNKE